MTISRAARSVIPALDGESLAVTSLDDLVQMIETSIVKTMQTHDVLNALTLDGMIDVGTQWTAAFERTLDAALRERGCRIDRVSEPTPVGNVRHVRFVALGTRADALLFASQHLTPESDRLLSMEGATNTQETSAELDRIETALKAALFSIDMARDALKKNG